MHVYTLLHVPATKCSFTQCFLRLESRCPLVGYGGGRDRCIRRIRGVGGAIPVENRDQVARAGDRGPGPTPTAPSAFVALAVPFPVPFVADLGTHTVAERLRNVFLTDLESRRTNGGGYSSCADRGPQTRWPVIISALVIARLIYVNACICSPLDHGTKLDLTAKGAEESYGYFAIGDEALAAAIISELEPAAWLC